MKRNYFLLIVAVLLMASTAMATLDEFSATFKGHNNLVEGSGSGWNGGEWIYYGQTDWWNQWFYDDPPSSDRWKHIEYDILIDIPLAGVVNRHISIDVALNWSNMDFPESGPEGTPPMSYQEDFIEREIVFSQENIHHGQEILVIGDHDIPDYNPEWVSIDVRVDAWGYVQDQKVAIPVNVDGSIYHECIPEPATMLMLAFGTLAMRLKKN